MQKIFTSIMTLVALLGLSSTAMAQSTTTYTNEPASVSWAFSDTENLDACVMSPDHAFSLTTANIGDMEVTGTATSVHSSGVTFVKLKPSGSTQSVEWAAKPAKGLTFTPTKVTMYITRFGTDAQSGVKITAKAGSTSELIGTFTAPRSNQYESSDDASVKTDKYAKSSDYAHGGKVEISLTAAQQKKFATTDFFTINATVGVGNTKEGGFSQVVIEGVLNGEAANVPKYTLTAVCKPDTAGTITITPKAAEYEEGTTVTLSVQKKFGFKFLNWTDAEGNEVSTSAKCTYTVNSNSTLTANMEKLPYASKQLYNFIIPDDGTLRDAITAANAASGTNRYYIFVRKGTYVTPDDSVNVIDCTSVNGKTYPSVTVYLNRSNVSIIGEDRDASILTNNVTKDTYTGSYGAACPYEGLHKSMVLNVNKNIKDTYIQDVTIKSSMGDKLGRNSAYEDFGDRTICYNIGMYGYQDTYYSGGNRYYFENCLLRGATDYLCGKGDAYFYKCNLMVCATGAKIAVPSSYKTYGYVFRDCTINQEKSGIDGNFTLGRPWGSGTPTARFLNTRMNAKPSAAGWDEMSGGYPRQFAEYNSIDSKGNAIDLSKRKTTFNSTYTNNPILTKEDYDTLTIQKVMGGTDNWDPTLYSAQLDAPAATLSGNVLTWNDNSYAMGWALCLEGDIVAFTTEPTYNLSAKGNYSVRAINQMGGLSAASAAVAFDGVTAVKAAKAAKAASNEKYDLQGRRILAPVKGQVYISNGKKAVM